MGLSSTVCLPLVDGRIQSRRYARQAPFTSRSEPTTGIYRSSKKESERFSIQGILSSFTGKDKVCDWSKC